ncbi:hypothetical protein PIB30_047039 [Stylosanthes scabra]|uniref:Uncharacterized protein n=1 Tax=Stylosanthes scabra TaxID=79078 RepID=A0ABU6RH96_9FABA|nr:hypothetical protein [Stylosanthes scabra]
MGRKSKDKVKGKEKLVKSKSRGENSSRDLPSIAVEDVSVVDNQILGHLEDLKKVIQSREETLASMVNATTLQVQTMAGLLAQQGRTIEALSARVSQLEGMDNGFHNSLGKKIPIVDLNVAQTRFLREIMRDVAAKTGLKKGKGPIDVDKYETVGLSKNAHHGCTSRTCKRKLEFVTFSTEDMNILYSIKQ